MTNIAIRLVDSFRRWNIRRRTIDALERLDDRILDDAGIDRYDIVAIADRRARERVAQDRLQREQEARERAWARQNAFRQSSRFQLALEHAAPAAEGLRTPQFRETARQTSRMPSVIDDIALGAALRGEPCHAC